MLMLHSHERARGAAPRRLDRCFGEGHEQHGVPMRFEDTRHNPLANSRGHLVSTGWGG
jgi:hypothetical protein